jgi:hypothetical protein
MLATFTDIELAAPEANEANEANWLGLQSNVMKGRDIYYGQCPSHLFSPSSLSSYYYTLYS